MSNQEFGGKTKSGVWLTKKIEDRFIRPTLLNLVPSWIETYHLTLMTIIWTIGVIVASYLAAMYNIQWLWLSSICILGQYITDHLDGTVGRVRNTGLVKWGYYTDHILDYLFFTSIVLGYSLLFPLNQIYLIVILAVIQAGFLLSLILMISVSNEFHIAFWGIGPTEARALYILFNIYLIFFGISLPSLLLPYFVIIVSIVFIVMIYRASKKAWAIDMSNKSDHSQMTG